MNKETSCDKELRAAVEEANSNIVLQYLERGADVNAGSENGWTPLMLAVLRDFPAIVKLLLEHGADPNLATQSEENPSRTALAVAISNGRFEAVKALVAYNANIDQRDHNGLMPIELAEKLSLRPFHRQEIVAIASFLKEAKAKSARQTSVLVNA